MTRFAHRFGGVEGNLQPIGPAEAGLSVPDIYPHVPKDCPAPFPKQSFWGVDEIKRKARTRDRHATVRRFVILACPAAITAIVVLNAFSALQDGSTPVFKAVMIGAFAINVYWLALLCTISLAGFLALVLGAKLSVIDEAPISCALHGKVALLMPIYAEPPEKVFASALAMLRSLADQSCGDRFDMFVLSDTRTAAIFEHEESLFAAARARLVNGPRLYYRRRCDNSEKKAGNIAEWCRRWGGAYDYMVVLDADSLMSGSALVRMAAAIECNPDVALIQAPSWLINRRTLFGRYQQFINRIFDYWCPMNAAGMAFWHRGASSYWGHNAIIRVCAFCGSAGLPSLSGRPPLGGDVQSHDFVEGALLQRAGWRICLMPDIEESYEEPPPTIYDWAIRERRWCQGNLQHARIITARGLSWMSRIHLAFGIMYMGSALLWLLALAAGLLFIADLRRGSVAASPVEAFVLFPDWVVQDSRQAAFAVLLTLGLIVLPKLLGFCFVALSAARRGAFGGLASLCKGTALAVVISMLLAPPRVLIRSAACLDVLCGRDSGWQPSLRDDRPLARGQLMRFHASYMLAGAVLALASMTICLPLFVWLLPVSLSLILAGPVAAVCASSRIGLRARASGWLLTPEEFSPPEISSAAARWQAELAELHAAAN